jgi:hypothetical protein
LLSTIVYLFWVSEPQSFEKYKNDLLLPGMHSAGAAKQIIFEFFFQKSPRKVVEAGTETA